MADFEEALNALLSNPEAMGQIMALAGSLGGTAQAEEQKPPPDLQQLGQMRKLMELFQTPTGPSPEAAALLQALRPFLGSERQRKLDRALKAAALSRTAKQALLLWQKGELHV